MWQMTIYSLFKRATSLDAETLENHGGGAKPREGSLKHIDADKGREPQPINAVKLAQNEAQKDHNAGKGHYGAVDGQGLHGDNVS
jgi:hypothetical protein